MSCLYPVFNMVKLLDALRDPISRCNSGTPPPPVLINDKGNEEYEVEAILDSCMFQQKLQYLVCWKGYRYEEHSWVNEADVEAPEAIMEFYHTNPGAPWSVWGLSAGHVLFHLPHKDTWP
jgi:hypothetical protein